MPRTKKIIDADAHVFEPSDIWLRYLDASLREVVARTPGLEKWQQHRQRWPEKSFSIGLYS